MYKKLFINPTASLLDAMRVIDRSATGIALVVDAAEKLLGTVSDGDIRRGILRNLPLQSPVSEVMNVNCYTVGQGAPRANIIDIMQARGISQIPIVDKFGRVIGVHLLRALLYAEEKDNPVVIMAGGRGTRLGELTKNTPKPMLKVAGRPILERIVLHLIGNGFTNLYISVNYLADVITDYFGDGSRMGCHIRYLREDKPLGSGGALSLLPEPKKSVLLMNGDLITEVNFSRMLDYHDDNQFYATMGYSEYRHEIPYGCLEVENGAIVELEEKPSLFKKVNAGIYIFSPEAVCSVPKNTMFPITNLFETALEQKKSCGAYSVDGDWIDVGQKEQLKQATGQQA